MPRLPCRYIFSLKGTVFGVVTPESFETARRLGKNILPSSSGFKSKPSKEPTLVAGKLRSMTLNMEVTCASETSVVF
jgi:hypothetical protein